MSHLYTDHPDATIGIYYAEGEAPLYFRYPEQIFPQEACIELDIESGNLSADYSGMIGPSFPPRVFRGLILRASVPNRLSVQAINNMLDEIAPLAARVCAGAKPVWDGNDWIGRLNDAAESAWEEIVLICEETEPDLEIIEVEDWWVDRCGDLAAAIAAVGATEPK